MSPAVGHLFVTGAATLYSFAPTQSGPSARPDGQAAH